MSFVFLYVMHCKPVHEIVYILFRHVFHVVTKLCQIDNEIKVFESERLMSFGFVLHCKPVNEVVYISILSLKKPLSLHSTTISCLVIIGSVCLKKNTLLDIVAVLLTGAIIDPEAYFDVYLSVLNSFIIVSDGLINWAILL